MSIWYVTFETVDGDVGVIEEVGTHIRVPVNDDVWTVINTEVQKYDPRAKIISHVLTNQDDDIALIADFFC